VPLTFVTFEAAGKAFAAAKANAVDILFIAIDPSRADVEFTPPYVLIEGTYMVRADSPLQDVADVDRPGVRVAVGLASAYDHFLTRALKNATVVRASKGGCCEMTRREARGRRRRAPATRGLCQDPFRPAHHEGPLPGHPPGHGDAEGPARRVGLPARVHRGDEGERLRRR
jgi:hypothetical protein